MGTRAAVTTASTACKQTPKEMAPRDQQADSSSARRGVGHDASWRATGEDGWSPGRRKQKKKKNKQKLCTNQKRREDHAAVTTPRGKNRGPADRNSSHGTTQANKSKKEQRHERHNGVRRRSRCDRGSAVAVLRVS